MSAIDNLSAKDRTMQAVAVSALATAGTTCDPSLLELWRQTDRFDVREHIVSVFSQQGVPGLPGLLELVRCDNCLRDQQIASVLTSGLLGFGLEAVAALVDEGERGSRGAIHLLQYVIERQAADPGPPVERLLRSPSPEVRSAAASSLLRLLPFPRRSFACLELFRDPSVEVRAAAAQAQPLPWPAKLRADAPEEFSRFVRELCELVAVDDPTIQHFALANLIENQVSGPELAARLDGLWRSPSVQVFLRELAMRAYLSAAAHSPDAIHCIVRETAHFPVEACRALASVDPALYSDDDIAQIVQALPRTIGREFEAAAELIVQVWGHHSGPRIGLRALPHLIQALSGADAALQGCALRVIGLLGPSAAAALPAILALRFKGYALQGWIASLLRIAPNDPAVLRAVTNVITAPHATEEERRNAAYALRKLFRINPDAPEVQKLTQPVWESPNHPLRPVILHNLCRRHADTVAVYVSQLIELLLDVRVRDTPVALTVSETYPKNVEIQQAFTHECHRRQSVARAIGFVRNPTVQVVEALVTSVRSSHAASRSLQKVLQSLKGWEENTGRAAAGALASVLDRHPEHFPRVIEGLSTDPAALLSVLGCASFESDGVSRSQLAIPANLPDRSRSVAIEALQPLASDDVELNGRIAVLRLLARLGDTNPHGVAKLKAVVLFGPGVEAPPAALSALGYVRPMTPELLDFIRCCLTNPRLCGSAIDAAGSAAEFALPLLDDLIAIGERFLRSSRGGDVATALTKIALNDPRTIEFVARYREPYGQ